jgi:hypothetical protein
LFNFTSTVPREVVVEVEVVVVVLVALEVAAAAAAAAVEVGLRGTLSKQFLILSDPNS